ncbi:MAG: hypothetical protein HZB71_10545 [Betaproteobacteria bacterium]|nr:hypothetical protein [Betaproteobacteria bacterium]
MIRFPQALAFWPSAAFQDVLKREIEALAPDLLPLQQGLAQSSHATGRCTAMILRVTEAPDALMVKVGLFYTGVLAGCSCADDPTPVDEVNEYCVVRFDIDRASGEASVTLLPDD